MVIVPSVAGWLCMGWEQTSLTHPISGQRLAWAEGPFASPDPVLSWQDVELTYTAT